MKKNKAVSGKVPTPREEAIQRLDAKGTTTEQWSDADARRLIHELRTHQIELEMQNEELRKARAELEASHSRYSDLYDFAPFGYFTFDQRGRILEVNLTGTTLLGAARSALSKMPFVSFISPEDQDTFHLHLRTVMRSGIRQSCEIRLVRKDGTCFHALLESIAVQDEEQKPSQCRTVVTDITGRKLAEAEMQSLARFPEENPNPVMRATSEGSILYANRPAGNLLAGMGCAAGGPLPDALLQGVRQVIADGRPREIEITNAEDQVFLFAITPSTAGEQINLYGIDITGRKQIADAQSFLLQSGYKGLDEDFFESLARYLAEKLHMHYVCIDQLHGDGLTAKTLAIYCDGKFEDNVEYSLKDTPCGEVVGKTICCFPKDVCRLFPRDTVLQELHAESYVGATLWSSRGEPIGLIAVIGLHQLPNPGTVETILQMVSVCAAGELERWQAEVTLRKLKDELELRVQERTSELAQAIKSMRIEIEGRKRMENELLESTQRLKTAQHIAHLGSWEWDVKSDRQLWSEEMYRIFGYEPQDITMTHDILFSAIHPEDKGYVTESVQEALEAGTSYNIDFRIIRADGVVRYLNSQAELFIDEQGSPRRMVGSVLDITDRKNTERELLEFGQQLRHLSGQLLTAQEVERKRIAGELHDELGQSMTVLKLRLRTIEKQLKGQEQVKNECLDLLLFTDEMLKSVRRICRDLSPSVLEDLGLAAAVRWLVDNFRQNPDLNIELCADNIDSRVPKLLQINVYRILQECLNNCVKHASARNITISIRKDQDNLTLCVEDDGAGFNPEQPASRDEPKKGMGMSTMRERALLLSGTIDIASREGAGTCVTLKIPCKSEEATGNSK